MSPPPAGRRTTPGRLVDALRRRLRPDRGTPPATVPGLGSGEETALAAAARSEPEAAKAADDEPAPDAPEPSPLPEPYASDPDPDAPGGTDARFDEARDRLRAAIEPADPDPDAD